MKISYVINTAASDPFVRSTGNKYRTASYNARETLLRERVLPAAKEQGFDEIIVAGCFEPGEGYQYVNVAPRFRDRRDALIQREVGARYSSGDILVFGHDDHAVGAGFCEALRSRDFEHADLIIPKRIHGITGTELNNGKKAGYMGGHVLVMKRWLWAAVPWTTVDTEFWDTSMTRCWTEAGGKLVYASDLTHVDVEATIDES